MLYYVYILRSLGTGRFYIGQTCDLEKRVKAHNSELAGYILLMVKHL